MTLTQRDRATLRGALRIWEKDRKTFVDIFAYSPGHCIKAAQGRTIGARCWVTLTARLDSWRHARYMTRATRSAAKETP